MGKKVAVKFFRSLAFDTGMKEIELLFELRHPNIVGIVAWFNQNRRAGIVLELCEKGKLSDAYKKDSFSSVDLLKVMAGSARAVCYWRERDGAGEG